MNFIAPNHPFILAVREVDLSRVKEQISKDNSLVNAQVRSDIYLTGKVWVDGEHVDIDANATQRAGALHFAAFHGHSELAQLLIDSGADPNAPADFGEKEGNKSTPCDIAAWQGDAPTLKVILESLKAAGIKTNLTPGLHSALAHGAHDKAELLIEFGAQHDFYTAAMAGDGEALKRLIETERDSIDTKHSKFDGTPLEEALKVGQLEMAELLAENGAEVSPRAAAAMGRVEQIKSLLDDDPEAATRFFGTQPLLIWATQGGQAEVVKLLLDRGADPNGGDQWDVTPLRFVGHVHGEVGGSIVDLLVEAGADVDRESRGSMPIQHALKLKNKHVHHRLVYHKDNDVEVTEPDAKFWKAIDDGDLEIVKGCLTEDGSLASKRFPTGNHLFFLTDGFPLYSATAKGHWDIAKLLLDHGADPDAKRDLEETGELGLGSDHRELGMPLHHAYDQGNFEMVHLLLDKGATVDAHPYCAHPFATVVYFDAAAAGAPTSMVLRSIPDLDAEDQKKIATIADDAPEVVKLYDRLLSLGAIPSHYSIAGVGDYETIKLLLEKHPTGNSNDWWGGNVHEALLYGSAWHGYGKVVEMCMEICEDRHTTYAAQHCIRNAITSHNRPGSFEDYYRIIELNLDYLKTHDALEEHDSFLPLHCLADGYVKSQVWGGELPTVEQQLKLAKLCLDKGVDINHLTFDYKLTALDHAINVNQKEYVDFLRQHGGKESKELDGSGSH